MERTEVNNLLHCGVYVSGKCNTDMRKELIEEAITTIQKENKPFQKQYLGIKNYASFGDQRCDCEYGMGPRHGSIVFDIGRTDCDESIKDKESAINLLLYSLNNPDVDVRKAIKEFDESIKKVNEKLAVIQPLDKAEI